MKNSKKEQDKDPYGYKDTNYTIMKKTLGWAIGVGIAAFVIVYIGAELGYWKMW